MSRPTRPPSVARVHGGEALAGRLRRHAAPGAEPEFVFQWDPVYLAAQVV